jgi:hypothetical protein
MAQVATRQSGGQARICSELGQGTMVCLDLPRHLGEEASAEPKPDTPLRAGQDETALAVDDEPTVRRLVQPVSCGRGRKCCSSPATPKAPCSAMATWNRAYRRSPSSSPWKRLPSE